MQPKKKKVESLMPDKLEAWISSGGTGTTPPPVSAEVVAESSPKIKRLTIDIPQPLHTRLRQLALDRDEPMADILRRLIEDAVNNNAK